MDPASSRSTVPASFTLAWGGGGAFACDCARKTATATTSPRAIPTSAWSAVLVRLAALASAIQLLEGHTEHGVRPHLEREVGGRLRALLLDELLAERHGLLVGRDLPRDRRGDLVHTHDALVRRHHHAVLAVPHREARRLGARRGRDRGARELRVELGRLVLVAPV